MCSDESDWTCLQPGFPIRKSSDHSLVIDSPRLIADSYVLLRFLVPRHPPCALKNLSHKDARVHCVVLKKRAAPHQTPRLPPAPTLLGAGKPWWGFDRKWGSKPVHDRPEGQAQRPSLQDPTTCQAPPPTRPRSTARPCEQDLSLYLRYERVSAPTNRCSTLEHPPPGIRWWRGHCTTDHKGPGELLLRKEVIQPHLPVRLPCYDLVPIASPTFDSSLPQGVGPPASGVTDFRDLTGGVYKARERIHRSVADLRLLATPTSWGRVADPNPN